MTLLQNKDGIETRQHTITTADTPEHLGGYMVASTIAFVDSSPDTITDTGSLFIKKGFKAGWLIWVALAAVAFFVVKTVIDKGGI